MCKLYEAQSPLLTQSAGVDGIRPKWPPRDVVLIKYSGDGKAHITTKGIGARPITEQLKNRELAAKIGIHQSMNESVVTDLRSLRSKEGALHNLMGSQMTVKIEDHLL